MSNETLEHLNTHTLIGFTDRRGTAWHYRADLQAGEPNHYTAAIPVGDVQRRLFHWTALSRQVAVEHTADAETILDDQGLPALWSPVPDRQAIVRSDTQTVMGIFATGYQVHQYQQWLLTTVANILDDDLAISSAGLLKDGAVAWVEVSVPDTITTPEGVAFRPNLLATTSHDGSIATTFKRTVTDVVCDNTRERALAEQGQAYKIRHSRHSQLRITEARDALAMIHSEADAFAAEVRQLCATPVSTLQWEEFLDIVNPMRDQDGGVLQGRARTMADRKRETLQRLYQHDARVAPWAGTAHGVLQAVNTYEHHERTVRGTPRADRNMLRTISGDYAKLDRQAWSTLSTILDHDRVPSSVSAVS